MSSTPGGMERLIRQHPQVRAEAVTAVGQGTTVYGRVPLGSPGVDSGRDLFAATQAAASRAEPNSALPR